MLTDLTPYVGPAAGIFTSVLWTGTSLLFTAAGRRLGALLVNASRIAMAIVLLGVTHRLLAGTWIPHALPGQVAYLAASGVVGLAIGDQALFTSFILIGPRLAMLCMTTAPLFATFFGIAVLGERLPPLAWAGIALTVAGVAWVVAERPRRTLLLPQTHKLRGVCLGIIASACQAGGLLLSKQGIGHGWLPPEQHIDAQSATLLRMFFAGVGMVPIIAWFSLRRRRARDTMPPRIGTRTAGWLFTVGGAIFGPFLGVWMSLVAADHAPVGVAQTLCSLTPVLILPFAHWVQKEYVSPRAIVGAVLAVAGTALLFLAPA